MLIRCALYVSTGNTVANSPVVHVPADSARLLEMKTNNGRAFVNVTQLDDDIAGIPRSFGIVPPALVQWPNTNPHPGWESSPAGIWAFAVWWESVVATIGAAG